jgi:hypothetical protein
MRADQLTMWVVYDHPRDYRFGFLARLWNTLPQPEPTDMVLVAPTLDELREQITEQEPWRVPLDRMLNDQPYIVEVWI